MQLNLSKRLILNFSIAVLFTLLSSAVGIYTFTQNIRALDKITELNIPTLSNAHDLAEQSKALTATAWVMLSAELPSQRETAFDLINDQIRWLDDVTLSPSTYDPIALQTIENEKRNLIESFNTLDQIVNQRIYIRGRIKEHLGTIADIKKTINNQPVVSFDRETIILLSAAELAASAVIETRRGRIKKLQREYDSRIEQLNNNLLTKDNSDQLKALTAKLISATDTDQGLFSMYYELVKVERAVDRTFQIYRGSAEQLIFATKVIIDKTKTDIDESTKASRRQLNLSGLLLIGIAIVGFITALIIALRIGRSIGGRIQALKNSMLLHQSGQKGEIPKEGSDEVAYMGKALDNFVQTIEMREHELRTARDELSDKLGLLEEKEVQIRSSQERFKDFAETAADWFWEMDSGLKFIHAAGHALEAMNLSSEDLIGKTLEEVCKNNIPLDLVEALKTQLPLTDFEFEWSLSGGESRFVRVSAKPLWTEEGAFLGYRGTGTDVTEAYLLSEKLSYQAAHDELTGLVNRREFERRLGQSIQSSQIDNSSHVLCFMDLDKFKVINDTCGHLAGDDLLKKISLMLKQHVRKHDLVARLGGDEFGIVFEYCSRTKAEHIATQLKQAISQFRFVWDNKIFSLGISIGLVAIEDSNKSVFELLKSADAACYNAKESGGDRVQVYDPSDTDVNKKEGQLAWVSRLNQALEEDRFQLMVQTISPISGKEHGKHFEVLLRMKDDADNLISPGAFLSAAERFGLAPKIDRWVITNTLSWLHDHPEQIDLLSVCSINLSAHSLTDQMTLDFITEELQNSGVPPSKICFEITETAAVANLEKAYRVINSLKEQGAVFALDDFGSGFSWFGQLKDMPVEYLKIDGSFVKDIHVDPIHRAMVKSINDIGQLMGKKTVAEFVENDEILRILLDIGVDFAQGYAIDKPQPIDSLLIEPVLTASHH